MTRFRNARELMAYLGLVPREESSGDTVRRGGITKTGNTHARRALIEAGWTYSKSNKVSRLLLKRQEGLPEKLKKISWNAQCRLGSRYQSLMARGKPKQKVVAAVARELCGFLFAVDREIWRVSEARK